jgi:hypothetical protein
LRCLSSFLTGEAAHQADARRLVGWAKLSVPTIYIDDLGKMVGTARLRAFAHPTRLASGRACPRGRLASIHIIEALGFGDVGKCALQVAQTTEDNAAVDVGIR